MGWLLTSKQKIFLCYEGRDYVATRLQNRKRSRRAVTHSAPQRLQEARPQVPPFPHTSIAVWRAEILLWSHLLGPPWPQRGWSSHTLWSLQMASAQTQQWGNPLHAGQMGQQTLVKIKHSQFVNFSIWLGLLWEKSRLLFHGLNCSERLPKNLTQLIPGSPSLSLPYTHAHTQSWSKNTNFNLKNPLLSFSILSMVDSDGHSGNNQNLRRANLLWERDFISVMNTGTCFCQAWKSRILAELMANQCRWNILQVG